MGEMVLPLGHADAVEGLGAGEDHLDGRGSARPMSSQAEMSMRLKAKRGSSPA